MLNWPSNLPIFEIDWSLKAKDNLITNQSERGPIKSRKKSTVSINIISGQIEYSSQQFIQFQEFYKNTDDGATSFLINDFISNKVQIARFKDWSAKRNSVNSFNVSLSLEVENR